MLQLFRMGFGYLKSKGIISTYYRTINFLDNKVRYDKIRRKHLPTEQILTEERNTVFLKAPKISILTPLYHTPVKFLDELIQSVEQQTYTNWELCFADGSETKSEITQLILSYSKKDPRILYKSLENNEGISGNTNRALDMATGDYITLLDHDDLITPDALYEFVSCLNKHQDADTIYSDEDKVDANGKSYFNPRYKSDFNIDYLLCNNYICHMFLTKTTIARQIGGFRKEMDGSQDYDFILRCCELSQNIYHIPKILYHWRYHANSTASNPQNKLYCFKAGQMAIQSHLKHMGIDATVKMCKELGYYRTFYNLPDVTDSSAPSISVIVYGCNSTSPDSPEAKRIKHLLSMINSKYVNKTIFIKGSQAADLNRIAYSCTSSHLLLIDSNIVDIFCEEHNPIDELLGYCNRSDVGVVSSRIYSRNHKIYHAGVAIGLYGYYGVLHRGMSSSYTGYYGKITMPQNFSAVDMSCTLIKRSALIAVNGFTTYESSFITSGIDICLKIRQSTNLLVVYNPWVQATINASAKRPCISEHDKHHFIETWSRYIQSGDPYYNPNLSLNKNNYSLK